jgi:adenylate cyclase
VRISAQLASVKDGYRLWNERYEREMKDIFAVEDEIAEQIALALKVALEPPATATAGYGATDDTRAYEYYLQGRQFVHQHRRKAFENALQIFSQAIEIDPHYARAYAGIAECHSYLRLYFGKGDEALDAADQASTRALELDPDLPDAHAARGMVLLLRREFEAAERHLRRAIELDPSQYEPHYISARLCFSTGRMQEAAAHFAASLRGRPGGVRCVVPPGNVLPPARSARPGPQRQSRMRRGREALGALAPGRHRAWTMGASVLADMGEPERSARWVERALTVDPDEPIIQYNAACVFVALGRLEDALRCLEVSLGQGGLSRDWATNDPDLDPLRTDPRFQT